MGMNPDPDDAEHDVLVRWFFALRPVALVLLWFLLTVHGVEVYRWWFETPHGGW